VDGTWPPSLPAGVTLSMQFWMPDAAGVEGWCASNAVRATTP
jgi:hypothetical protein